MDNAAMVVKDRETRLVVATALACAGYACSEFSSTMALLRGVRRDDLQLIVIDVEDHADDWRALVEWRQNWLNPAVAVIALVGADTSTTAGVLEAGADDCMAKPVQGPELLARVKAALRRRSAPAGERTAVSVAGCTVDRDRCCLQSRRSQVALTGRELALAQVLFENVGRIVTRQRLASEVWGGTTELAGRTIEQHVYQVRRKLRRCVGDALQLRSVYGSGYRLDLPVTARGAADLAEAAA